jgi:hypothetical protein
MAERWRVLMLRWLATGAALVLGAGIGSPAGAAVHQLTISGRVTDGVDSLGLFGPAGAALDGSAFTATAQIDTAVAPIITVGTMDVVQDGFGWSLSINGHAFNIVRLASDAFGYDLAEIGSRDDTINGVNVHSEFAFADAGGVYDPALSYRSYLRMQARLDNAPGTFPRPFGTPFSVGPTTFFNGPSLFEIACATCNGGSGAFIELLDLKPDTVTMTDIAAAQPITQTRALPLPPTGVAEPATWAMLILGFGLVGSKLRRLRPRRRQVLFATR